jgi:hypothetical protein
MHKPEGKRPPGRPRHRSGSNIKMDLRDIGRGTEVGSCEHGNEHSGSIECWEFLSS